MTELNDRSGASKQAPTSCQTAAAAASAGAAAAARSTGATSAHAWAVSCTPRSPCVLALAAACSPTPANPAFAARAAMGGQLVHSGEQQPLPLGEGPGQRAPAAADRPSFAALSNPASAPLVFRTGSACGRARWQPQAAAAQPGGSGGAPAVCVGGGRRPAGDWPTVLSMVLCTVVIQVQESGF